MHFATSWKSGPKRRDDVEKGIEGRESMIARAKISRFTCGADVLKRSGSRHV